MYPKVLGVIYPFFAFVSLVFFVCLLIPNQQEANNHKVSVHPKDSSPLKNIRSSVSAEKKVEYRGNFIVLRNYVPAERQFEYHESVTLSVPGDYRFLDNVIPLVDRWEGPISIGLYAPGYDFFSTLQSIAYLRKCSPNQMIKEFVSFHLFFEHEHMPVQHDLPILNIYKDEFDCSQKPPFETVKDEDMYKEKKNLTYPINVARNVAKLAAQTHFVFPSDIELYPTRNFIKEFLNFVERRPEHFQKDSKNVFVLPLFEILADFRIPETKKELQKMLQNETAITFHQQVCDVCHKVPRLQEWINGKEETKGLDVFTVAKRQGQQVIWEPFFVCTQKEPLWDERLNWEGQGNKMCQAYYLCMLDYDFIVLNNAFLIHKPGVKKTKVQNVRHRDQLAKNDQILRNIQEEISRIYGKNEKCRIHNVFKKKYR